jgi:hypothetical protein
MVPEKRRLDMRIRDELGAAARDGYLYVILDAARIPGLGVMLGELNVEHEPLIAGRNSEDLSAVVPFLARLPLRETLLWFRLEPDALTASMFAASDATFAGVRRHLKRFLRVWAADGRPLYFRFYDPRILGPFLSACSGDERAVFFGPVRSYLARDPEDDDVSDRPALSRWSPGTDKESVSTAVSGGAAPTAERRFRFRPEHEAALAADAMSRYQKRAVGWLRVRCRVRVAGMTDRQLVKVLDQAKTLGEELGMEAGRDVTMLAEALVHGAEREVRANVGRLAPELRRAGLIRVCQRLAE